MIKKHLNFAYTIIDIKTLDELGWKIDLQIYRYAKLLLSIFIIMFLTLGLVILGNVLILNNILLNLNDLIYILCFSQLYFGFYNLLVIFFSSKYHFFKQHPQKDFLISFDIPKRIVLFAEYINYYFFKLAINISLLLSTMLLSFKFNAINIEMFFLIILSFVNSIFIPLLGILKISSSKNSVIYNNYFYLKIIIISFFFGVLSATGINLILESNFYLIFNYPNSLIMLFINIIILVFFLFNIFNILKRPINFLHTSNLFSYNNDYKTERLYQIILFQFFKSMDGITYIRIISIFIFVQVTILFSNTYIQNINFFETMIIYIYGISSLAISELLSHHCSINNTIKFTRFYWEKGVSATLLTIEIILIQIVLLFSLTLTLFPLILLNVEVIKIFLMCINMILSCILSDALFTIPKKGKEKSPIVVALVSVILSIITAALTINSILIGAFLSLMLGGFSICFFRNQILIRPFDL